jgi:hypothetical protein
VEKTKARRSVARWVEEVDATIGATRHAWTWVNAIWCSYPQPASAAASQRSLQACIASLPLQSSLMSKTYLKSDRFNGGGSARAAQIFIELSRWKRNRPFSVVMR